MSRDGEVAHIMLMRLEKLAETTNNMSVCGRTSPWPFVFSFYRQYAAARLCSIL